MINSQYKIYNAILCLSFWDVFLFIF